MLAYPSLLIQVFPWKSINHLNLINYISLLWGFLPEYRFLLMLQDMNIMELKSLEPASANIQEKFYNINQKFLCCC